MEKITLANLPNQEKMLAKGDQILGRLADQTIVAKAVKSIQRGTLSLDNYYTGTRNGRANISPVDTRKSLLIVNVAGGGVDYFDYTVSLSGNYVEARVFSGKGNISWQVIEFY